METPDIPHVHVSVTFRGETVEQDGQHFIDAVHFLCHAEEAVRHNLRLRTPVDPETSKVQQENLRKLLTEGKPAS